MKILRLKFWKILSIGITLFFILIPFFAKAIQLPQPTGFVNDFADILIESEEAEIENILTSFESETSNEITVVVADNFQGLDKFSYSQELFTEWGLGKSGKNNGILFLIGPKEGLPFPERGEIFINIGKGLEGALTDSMAGSILRSEVFPEFTAKNYFSGIKKGVTAIVSATKGEYTADEDTSTNAIKYGDLFFVLIWFGFVLLSYLASFLGRTKAWWLGGVLGGAGGLAIGLIFFTGLFIAGSVAGLAVLGLIFDFVVSKNYAHRKKLGKPTDFWHSGGGFWFGGGRGGFGGGGFGGFGGGRSGGGGAGGGW